MYDSMTTTIASTTCKGEGLTDKEPLGWVKIF